MFRSHIQTQELRELNLMQIFSDAMLGTDMESVHMCTMLKKTTSKAILYSRIYVRVCKLTRKLQLYERTETPYYLVYFTVPNMCISMLIL